MAILPRRVDKQATEILTEVCFVLEQQIRVSSCFSVFLFGSVLRGGSNWADIDILIVVEDTPHGDRIRSAINPILAIFPIHLTILNQSEIDEVGLDAFGPLQKIDIVQIEQ